MLVEFTFLFCFVFVLFVELKGLVTNYGEGGGYKTRRWGGGGILSFTPMKRGGGGKSFNHAEGGGGGHTQFWGSF